MRTKDVYEVINQDERFSILAEILESTGMGEEILNDQKVFTFFAPTDDALAHLSRPAIELLKSPKGRDLAKALISRHVIPGQYLYSDELRMRNSLRPLRGGDVMISVENNAVRFGRAPVRTPGIAARNGVIFPVDRMQPVPRRTLAA
ncbi:MAG: fasciclin domain-containing protein [Pyrinomonadaceae bacterium]